jgi:hypothetical protein
MAIGLDFSMVKKSGLFLVPVTDDHVKYADLFRALIEVAQARPKPSSHEHERKMMFAGQVSHRLREAGMLISFALAGYFLVAMFSYDALDPSWSHSGSNTEIANFGGTAGAWMADLLFYLFGFLAFLLPQRHDPGQNPRTERRRPVSHADYPLERFRADPGLGLCAVEPAFFGRTRHHAAGCRRHSRADYRQLLFAGSRFRRRDGDAPGAVSGRADPVHRPVVAGADRQHRQVHAAVARQAAGPLLPDARQGRG